MSFAQPANKFDRDLVTLLQILTMNTFEQIEDGFPFGIEFSLLSIILLSWSN
jgi:hypothetical protein